MSDGNFTEVLFICAVCRADRSCIHNLACKQFGEIARLAWYRYKPTDRHFSFQLRATFAFVCSTHEKWDCQECDETIEQRLSFFYLAERRRFDDAFHAAEELRASMNVLFCFCLFTIFRTYQFEWIDPFVSSNKWPDNNRSLTLYSNCAGSSTYPMPVDENERFARI